MSFEGFYSPELRSLMVKTIRKHACEEFLAAKYVRAKLKSIQKGLSLFFSKIIATLLILNSQFSILSSQ